MMRLKSPITTGLSRVAKPTRVIPVDLAKDSAAELIAPTAIIISIPDLTAFATNSHPILPDNPIILA